MNEEPILTYNSDSLNGKQTVTLWSDRVSVKGTVLFKGEYEATFPLKTVSPNYQIFTMRNSSFWHSFLMIIVTIGIAGVFHAIPGTDATSFFGTLITAAPLCFVVMCLMTFRKVRMIYFLNAQGQHLFGVVKEGKETSRFDEVVSRIVTQIRSAEQPAGAAGTTVAQP